MRKVRMILLSAAMMACGAGLLAVVQKSKAGTDEGRRAEVVRPGAGIEAATVRPVVVVADPAGTAKDRDELASISGRIAGIEAKLDALANHAMREAPGDEILIRPPEHRSDGEQQGMTEATRIVDAALSRGNWLDADQSRLREIGTQLPPGDRFALRVKLANAANEGKMRDLAARPFFF